MWIAEDSGLNLGLDNNFFNPLNAELNPICHLLALLKAQHILHVCRIRVNPLASGSINKRYGFFASVT